MNANNLKVSMSPFRVTLFIKSWFSCVLCCCWEDKNIIANVSLDWASSLRGHCVNAPHLPADLSPDWLLMTFLGHRHVKLFIYARKGKKKRIPGANSPFHPENVLPHDCVPTFPFWFLFLCPERWWCVCSPQQSLWYMYTAVFYLFLCVFVCMYVSVCIFCTWQIWNILDLLRKWHTPYRLRSWKRFFSKLQSTI